MYIYILFDYIFFIQKFMIESTVDYGFLGKLVKKKLNDIFLKIDI